MDFNNTMRSHLPLVFAFVLGLAFLLLLVMFRSLVIPLVTIVLNMLSVGAAYGVTVLIFQDGYLRSLIGAQDIGGVIDWIPLFLFVVPVRPLDGLPRADPEARIREAHERGLPTSEAVAEGIRSTAGIIPSAAAVMIAVVSIFAILHEVAFKQLGITLAAAVLIDATLVRIVLLPSVMKLLGSWNWYFPGRAAKSPRVAHLRQRRRNSTSPTTPKPSKTRVKEGKSSDASR